MASLKGKELAELGTGGCTVRWWWYGTRRHVIDKRPGRRMVSRSYITGRRMEVLQSLQMQWDLQVLQEEKLYRRVLNISILAYKSIAEYP